MLPASVADAVTAVDDNWKKLKATRARELHFMMDVTWSSPGDVYFALTDNPTIPSVAPKLPKGITHFWVFDVNTG